MNFSDLKPGMILRTQYYGNKYGHVQIVDSVDSKTGKIKVLEAKNPDDGLVRSTLCLINLEQARVVIPPKLDIIAPKMLKVAHDYIDSGRHYTKNIHDGDADATLLDEYYKVNGVKYPLYNTNQDDITKPQVKKQFQCASFCLRTYNKVAKHEKDLNLPLLRRTHKLSEIGTAFVSELPEGFRKEVIISPNSYKTPNTFFRRGSLKISRIIATQMSWMEDSFHEASEKLSKAEEKYANRSFFYRAFKGRADRGELVKLEALKDAISAPYHLIYNSLDEESKKEFNEYLKLNKELNLEDKFDKATPVNDDGSPRLKYTLEQLMEARNSSLKEALGDTHPGFTQKIDKSSQLTQSVFAALALVSEVNVPNDEHTLEANKFLDENCKRLNRIIMKHDCIPKILFESHERHDKKMDEIKQISSYIELNKNKHENFTNDKFNEWKEANKQQQEKADIEKINLEAPNHVWEVVTRQETVAPVQQPELSNSQTLNVAQSDI